VIAIVLWTQQRIKTVQSVHESSLIVGENMDMQTLHNSDKFAYMITKLLTMTNLNVVTFWPCHPCFWF
jgi:hypothetical protein